MRSHRRPELAAAREPADLHGRGFRLYEAFAVGAGRGVGLGRQGRAGPGRGARPRADRLVVDADGRYPALRSLRGVQQGTCGEPRAPSVVVGSLGGAGVWPAPHATHVDLGALRCGRRRSAGRASLRPVLPRPARACSVDLGHARSRGRFAILPILVSGSRKARLLPRSRRDGCLRGRPGDAPTAAQAAAPLEPPRTTPPVARGEELRMAATQGLGQVRAAVTGWITGPAMPWLSQSFPIRRFGLGMELFHAHLCLMANSLREGEP